jgi:ribose transport system permease protein
MRSLAATTRSTTGPASEAEREGIDPPAGPEPAVTGGRRRREIDWVRFAQQWGMVIVLLLMVVAFSALRPHSFATLQNLETTLSNQAVLILVATAVMIALVVGGFDLSVTAVLSLAGVMAIGLQGRTGLAWPVAALICLGVGTAVGLINGLIVGLLRLNSFVVTLATQTVLIGLITWYTNGEVLFLHVDKGFTDAGQGDIGGFVYPLFLALFVVALTWYMLEHTATGRQMYATGANYDAARLSGIPAVKLTVIAFVLAGFIGALAGLVQAAKIGSGQPDIGTGYLLPGFASAFLGASAIRVGRFNPWGTLLGVLLVATGFNGLVLLNVALWVQPVFYGLVLLVAIATPIVAERMRRRRALGHRGGGSETGSTPAAVQAG